MNAVVQTFASSADSYNIKSQQQHTTSHEIIKTKKKIKKQNESLLLTQVLVPQLLTLICAQQYYNYQQLFFRAMQQQDPDHHAYILLVTHQKAIEYAWDQLNDGEILSAKAIVDQTHKCIHLDQFSDRGPRILELRDTLEQKIAELRQAICNMRKNCGRRYSEASADGSLTPLNQRQSS